MEFVNFRGLYENDFIPDTKFKELYTATIYFIPSLLYLVYTCGAALKYTKSPCTYLTRYLGLR